MKKKRKKLAQNEQKNAKIGARLTLKDGKQRSMEEIIDLLREEYEKSNKERRNEKRRLTQVMDLLEYIRYNLSIFLAMAGLGLSYGIVLYFIGLGILHLD